MKRKAKNLLAVAGIIATVVGIMGAIPSLLHNNVIVAIVSIISVIGGIILLAISFGDE
jgi:hypothetical protein